MDNDNIFVQTLKYIDKLSKEEQEKLKWMRKVAEKALWRTTELDEPRQKDVPLLSFIEESTRLRKEWEEEDA